MAASKVDTLYRKIIFTKFYTKGWGNPNHLKEIFRKHDRIANREICCSIITKEQVDSVTIDSQTTKNGLVTIHGHFNTPLAKFSPKLVDPVIETARFEFVVPERWADARKSTKNKKEHSVKALINDLKLKPVCVHLAGTGDHGFRRRRELLAKPLLKNSGIASLILENPYYGSRKPKEQSRSGLLYVTDLFVMGACLILETQILLRWLKKEGYGPLGLTGISMGGHMASLAATNWPEPISLVPCLSWTTSSVVWTEGVLSKTIPWETLEKQLLRDFVEWDEMNKIDKESINAETTAKVKLKKSRRFFRSQLKSDEIKQIAMQEQHRLQAIEFMKKVMDRFTHLGNYSKPVDTSLVCFVIAKNDGYYPCHISTPMTDVWPGCEVRYLDRGHITGFLWHQSDFEMAISDSFEKQIKTYICHQEEEYKAEEDEFGVEDAEFEPEDSEPNQRSSI